MSLSEVLTMLCHIVVILKQPVVMSFLCCHPFLICVFNSVEKRHVGFRLEVVLQYMVGKRA